MCSLYIILVDSMFLFLGTVLTFLKEDLFLTKLKKKRFGKEFQEQNKGGDSKGLPFRVLESWMQTDLKIFLCLMRCFTSVVHPEPQLLQVWFWWWRCWGHRPHGGCRFLLLCWSRGPSYPAGAEAIRATVAVEGGHSTGNQCVRNAVVSDSLSPAWSPRIQFPPLSHSPVRKESRLITTSSSSRLIYDYCRLLFGIRKSQEEEHI